LSKNLEAVPTGHLLPCAYTTQEVVNIDSRRKQMSTEKCPVCDWAINDGGIKVTVGGKEITVCCDECVEKAQENPSQYAA